MNIPVLIPAYKPDSKLLSVVTGLSNLGFEKIIVINDGSGPEHTQIFERLKCLNQCQVLEHAVNLGKGRALKTGFNYIYLNFPDAAGVVTVDADGQHLPHDVLKVSSTFLNGPDKFVMGFRIFSKNIPLRSLIGNVITKHVFRFLVGKKIADTQSGLRCIPRRVLPEFIRLSGEGYEYEMNMLISTKQNNLIILEEEINTVYIENNRSSHFNPLIDSMKIYFLLLRFSFSSIFASTIDFVVFTSVYLIRNDILTGMVLARLVAGSINYFMNKSLVFHSRTGTILPLVRYFLLFVVLGVLAYLLIRTLTGFGVNVIAAKVMTETLLFFASFSIQRDFIFVGQEDR